MSGVTQAYPGFPEHAPVAAPTILLADDDGILRLMVSRQLQDAGYRVLEAESGEQALHLLEEPPVLAVVEALIVDRRMGDIDGLELARQLKSNPSMRHLPIIMLTASGKPEQIRQGLEAGVFYYLNKPTPMNVLQSVLDMAVQESRRRNTLRREMHGHRSSFQLMQSGSFAFRTLAEVEQLACFVASSFPDPQRVLAGLAELMINAVEHGLLGIGYAEKGQLLQSGHWRAEVERRLHAVETAYATLTFTRREHGCYVSIRENGPGFNWREFLSFNPARAGDMHGRGIAQASAAFDQVTFNEAGNEAVGFVGNESPLRW